MNGEWQMIKKFFVIDIKTLKFLLVGIINTLVGTGIMYVLYNVFHVGYWISSAMNYIVGSVVSYFLNKYFTFNYKKKSKKTIVKFIVNISICYFVAYGIAKRMVYVLFIGFEGKVLDNIAMLCGMIIFVGLNYLGQRFFVFSEVGRKQ